MWSSKVDIALHRKLAKVDRSEQLVDNAIAVEEERSSFQGKKKITEMIKALIRIAGGREGVNLSFTDVRFSNELMASRLADTHACTKASLKWRR